MKYLEQTMRWYGPGNDVVSLEDIRHSGATGVITALHHIPTGEVWPLDEIIARKKEVEAAGLRLSGIESVNIHDSIKTAHQDRDKHIENYITTLKNLGKAGIDMVAYNFMPVLDWTRTDLHYEVASGAHALRFNFFAYAAYDLFILQRPGAKADYSEEQIQKAEGFYKGLNNDQITLLTQTVMAGLPGTKDVISKDEFFTRLDMYKEIGRDELKQNFKYFLQAIIPAAEEAGVKMAVHPDDPPFPLFGLPRIVSTAADYDDLLGYVDSQSNGLCFCTGSLGARPDNDLPAMIEQYGSKINFLHIRNVKREGDGSFHEDNHLEGTTDMPAVMMAVINEQIRREEAGREDVGMVMRPDHGHQMLDDLAKDPHPGYGAIGRLKGLAELRGLETGIRAMMGL
ncbi:MAG: mannonate dehydratase [Cyclobacteriaceae bacterium]|nr:mannonate dehydratase [Cyclobacteriaceae bacterium]